MMRNSGKQTAPAGAERFNIVANKGSAVTRQKPIVRVNLQSHRAPFCLKTTVVLRRGSPCPLKNPGFIPEFVGRNFWIMAKYGFPGADKTCLIAGRSVHFELLGQ